MPNNLQNKKIETTERLKKVLDHIAKLNFPLVKSTIKPIALYTVSSILSEAIKQTSIGYIDDTYDELKTAMTFIIDNLVTPMAASTLYKAGGDLLTSNKYFTENQFGVSFVILYNFLLRISTDHPYINGLIDKALTAYNFRENIYFFTGCHPFFFSKSAVDTLNIDFFLSQNLDYTFVTCKDKDEKTLFTTKFNIPILSKFYQHKVGYLPGKWCKDNDKWVFTTPVPKEQLIRECNDRYAQCYFSDNNKVDSIYATTPLGNQYDIYYYTPITYSSINQENPQEAAVQNVVNKINSSIDYLSTPPLVKFDETKKNDANNRDKFIQSLTSQNEAEPGELKLFFWLRQQENQNNNSNSFSNFR
ncbi:hypothetical protein [Fastidiosibacter lacustris]|uniref:hypothetical protein n=1 Tax=Fastidiosibacter lacustris TaxID=2056695 RepID=UPI000E345002|nr:hypothetical protein [Fastidiosibacter lacustris]